MAGLVVRVVDRPLVENVDLVIDEGLVEVFAFGRVVAFDLQWLVLHRDDLPPLFADELDRASHRIRGEAGLQVAGDEGATGFGEIGAVGQRTGFQSEHPHARAIEGNGGDSWQHKAGEQRNPGLWQGTAGPFVGAVLKFN